MVPEAIAVPRRRRLTPFGAVWRRLTPFGAVWRVSISRGAVVFSQKSEVFVENIEVFENDENRPD